MNQRYYSLDVFRGATVALMILVNNPGNWGHIYTPLEHATWHGLTPTDLVFPFFLFAVGNALAFVMPRFEQAGTSVFLRKVFKRAALIFLIGLFLNWSPFIKWEGTSLVGKPWETIRIMGVLQRIALCYLFGALLVFFVKKRSHIIIVSVLILMLYWLICYAFGAPGDPYSLPGFFGTAVDTKLLGTSHLYRGEGVAFDPEGLASTLAAIVQVVGGYLVGSYIRLKGKSFDMLAHLFIAGAALIFIGYCWDMSFPVNKKIWTCSFVVYTTGLATIIIALMIYLVEFKQETGWWSRFFDVFGKNPLFIFVLSGFLPRVLALLRWVDHTNAEGKPVYMTAFSWFYEYVCKPVSSELKVGSLVYAICMVVFYWSIGYVLDKRKIYIKV